MRLHALGASAENIAALGAQLGWTAGPLDGSPDLVVHFVERLERERLSALGADAACSGSGFFVVEPLSRTLTKIPFADIGKQPEILVERAARRVPLLEPIVNLTALANGGLALHASAFEVAGSGSAIAGWPRGGKTTTLLAFADLGARFVADDWVYVGRDGHSLHGTLHSIHLSERHLRGLSAQRRRLTPLDRMGLRTQTALEFLDVALLHNRSGGRGPWTSFRRLAGLLKERLDVEVRPEQLFAKADPAVSLDRLFLLLASPDGVAGTRASVEPVDGDELAARLVQMLAFERLRFTGYYAKFRFAFPDLHSPFVDRASELEQERLAAMLADTPGYLVRHPEDARGKDIIDAMRPYCRLDRS